MQLSIIFVTTVFVFILLLNSSSNGKNIDFPFESCAFAISSGDYWPCVTQLANSIWKLHQWSEDTPINICGISCNGNLKGRFSSWKWKWDGRFRCDSKAPGIVGQDARQSRKGAMEWAIKDFLNKAITSGHINAKDFQC
jgi:hypothetical protein